MSIPLSLLLRTSTLIVIGIGVSYLPDLELTHYLDQMEGGRWQLLTLHGLALAALCEAVGLLQLLFPRPGLRNLHHLLLLVALPAEIIVSLVYWPLNVAAHFILPFAPDIICLLPQAQLDQRQSPFSLVFLLEHPGAVILPIVPDLCLHLIPTLFLLAGFLSSRTPPALVSRPSSVWTILVSLGAAYGLFLESCFASNPTFPYPFLTLSPFPLRVVIYGSATYAALYISAALRWQEAKGSGLFGAVQNLFGVQRKPIISGPYEPVHLTHVGYNHQTNEYIGLPREWAEQVGIRRV